MNRTEPQFVTDANGERIAVLIGIDEYRQMLDALDESDARQAYDEAKVSGDEAIPFERAIGEIERDRRAA